MKRLYRLTLLWLLFAITLMPTGFAQRLINSVDSTTYQFLSTRTQPSGIVLADFNNDAFPDMAIISIRENLISVRYNDRAGRLGAPTDFPVGANPQSVAAADLNNDGRTDLITSNQNGTTSVLINSVNGFLGVSGTYASTQGDSRLVVTDVDGDGWLDIVTGGGWGEYRILTNNGNGTFTSGQAVTMPDGVWGIAAADVDGDTRPDLVILSNLQANVRVLRNMGNSTFTQIGKYTTSSGPFCIGLGDLNADGRPDLVVGIGSQTNELIMLPNTGNGQFGPSRRIGSVELPFNLIIKDISGDGLPDLVVSSYSQTYVSVWLGKGNGTFGSINRYHTGAGPAWLAIADLNGDGLPDAGVINRNNSTATVLLNRGQGRFGSASITSGEAFPSLLADTDRDGYADLVGLILDTTATSSIFDNALYVYHNQRNGTFAPPRYQSLGIQTYALTKGDLNNDGWVDLVSTNYNGNTIAVLLNNQQGLFLPPVKYSTGPGASQPRASELADVNADGFLDIITYNSGSNATSIAVFINRGDGTFDVAVQYAMEYLTVSDFTVADFNGDDRPDFAVLLYRSFPERQTFIRLYLNTGNGSFESIPNQLLSKEAGTLISYDMNADGHMDLLLGVYSDPGTSFMQNNGNGTFTGLQTLFSGDYGRMFTHDVNDDGLADLFVLQTNYPLENGKTDVSVRLNTGMGSFSAPFRLPLGFFESLSTGDVNGDGRPDVLTGATNGMYIWYNLTLPALWGITTAQPGPWNMPQTWSTNRLPIATDHVLIRHPVQLPPAYTGQATRIGFDTNGRLQYSPNAKLRLQKYP